MYARAMLRATSLFLLSIAAAACAPPDDTGAQNKATSERFVQAVWNEGNVALIDEMVAANFVRHMPASWEPSQVDGPTDFKEYITATRERFPAGSP